MYFICDGADIMKIVSFEKEWDFFHGEFWGIHISQKQTKLQKGYAKIN